MRYVFWLGFCALVSYSIAGKSGSIAGPAGAFGVLAYGALVGLSLAVATRTGDQPRLLPRLLISACWIALGTGLYFLVFRAVSYGSNQTIIMLGVLFSSPAPIIWIARGLMAGWRRAKPCDSKMDQRSGGSK